MKTGQLGFFQRLGAGVHLAFMALVWLVLFLPALLVFLISLALPKRPPAY